MLGLVGLAVLLLAYGLMHYYSGKTAQAAAERFTSAITTEDCDFVVQKYPGSVAAGDALMRKAELLWNDGKKESSVGALRQFEKDYGTHPMRPAALFGLATKLANMGEKAGAREELNGILNKYPNSEFAPAAQIQLGDMLWEEGKTDEAKKLFESLGRLYPGKMTALMDLVERRIRLMDSGLPTKEVEPPPAPKPPAAPKLPMVPGAAPLPKPMAPPQITAPTLTPPSATSPATNLPVPPLPGAKPALPQSSATIPVPAPTPAHAAPAPVPVPAPKAPAAPPSAATPPAPAPAPSNPNNLPIPPPPPVKSNP
jgi:TolA-binding protein